MLTSEQTNISTEEPTTGPSESEERTFVMNLHRFMKERGTPIERIPHLGFKQINLWKIYQAVEILGGYDSVTARRLWKNVYDELGGSPGSTSAATCTRRHYERLVLPFERHCRGEEDKPLPPSKPRKQYKRSEENKSKTESKKRRRTTERDEKEEHPRPSHHCERGVCSHSEPWQLSPDHPDGDQILSQDPCHREKPLFQPLIPALVISPLEKKKRLAQASLSVASAAGQEEATELDRPSVIHLSHSSAPSGCVSRASDGSPLPLSSASSRSPSPFSVSSEDCVAVPAQKTPGPEVEKQKPASFTTAALSETHSGVRVYQPLPLGWYPSPKEQTSLPCTHYQNLLHANSVHPDKPHRHSGLRIPMPASLGSAYWVSSASSFTKVVPRAHEWRPISLQPPYKPLPLPKRPSSTEAYTKKIPSPLYPDRKDKAKMAVPKPMPTQQYLIHQAGLPVPYHLPSFERHRAETMEQMKTLPIHPILLPAQLNMPPSQTHPTHPLQAGANFSGPYDAAMRPYPYSVPVWHPPIGYSMATLQPY